MALIVKPPHGVIDDLIGVFGSLLGQVEIDHGGLELAVTHVALDDSGVDAGLQ